MKDSKKDIRRSTWIILVFFILGFIILIGASLVLVTFENLIPSWQFYIANVISEILWGLKAPAS